MMKSTYFTMILSMAILFANGQSFTIDNTYNPTTADKYTSYFLDKTTQPGSAGANQVWDFSGVKQDSAFGNIGMEVPASKKSQYPNANVAQVTDYGDTTFYQASATQLVNWGYYSTLLGSTKYTDGQIILSFPFSYGDSFTDSVKGTSAIKPPNLNTIPTIRKGQATITYDGWGSLLLPGGKTYSKVARVKSVLEGEDKINLTGVPSKVYKSTITSYSWYAAGINYPVLNITAISSPGLLNDQVVIMSGPYVPNAVMDAALAKAITVSPNPTNDMLNVQVDLGGNSAVNLELKDATGRTILNKTGVSGSSSLNLSNLNSGVYYLQVLSGSKMAIKKIVKN